MTLFETPQATLLPDPTGPRWYANIDNRLEVNAGGKPFHVAVAVPTMLFSLMADTMRVDRDTECTLAIDLVGERYVLSLLAGDDLFDLWHYSKGSIPLWILDRKRAV